jgi:hypothetical protein
VKAGHAPQMRAAATWGSHGNRQHQAWLTGCSMATADCLACLPIIPCPLLDTCIRQALLQG